jgi:hypothetical protein
MVAFIPEQSPPLVSTAKRLILRVSSVAVVPVRFSAQVKQVAAGLSKALERD